MTLVSGVLSTWNYGYTVGSSGGTYTVMKPDFNGVQPPYVIVKPSHTALRAGLSVFKPTYAGLKPDYKPDYVSKPSYSGLRPGLQPMYLSEGAKRRRALAKKMAFDKMNKSAKKWSPDDKEVHQKKSHLKNSNIYVTQVNANTGRVVRSYQVDSLNDLDK